MKSDIITDYAAIVEQQLDQIAVGIKSIREAAGWSRQDLAHRAGISQEALGMIERGLRRPHVPTLLAIAEVLRAELGAVLIVVVKPDPRTLQSVAVFGAETRQ